MNNDMQNELRRMSEGNVLLQSLLDKLERLNGYMGWLTQIHENVELVKINGEWAITIESQDCDSDDDCFTIAVRETVLLNACERAFRAYKEAVTTVKNEGE